MKQPYLYSNIKHVSHRAVVVLPEIFGVTDFIKGVVDKCAEEFQMPAYALDHFYAVTGKFEVFDYAKDAERGMAIMNQMTGEQFMNLFTQALDEIQAEQPDIQEFIVLGFCFGGRLAYLSGVDKRVSRVVSFYGGQPHKEGYYKGMTPVGALAEARKGDEGLAVLGLYGGQDASIPAEDRAKTKQLFGQAGISYTEKVYEQAGHAFFNNARPTMYSAQAAAEAWQAVIDFIR